MIFFDTETCGLHGPIVLIQYAKDNDPVTLVNVWKQPIEQTLLLIESFCNEAVCGFNLAFDWFHICQLYTTLQLLADKVGFDAYPEDHITEYAMCESFARDGPCLKPKSALDIMLHARKGQYQSTMDRHPIRIKRVPTPLAHVLSIELNKRIPLKDIYFAKRKNQLENPWEVCTIESSDGTINPDFRDIVLKFAPSSALKTLAADALNLKPDEVLLFADIEVPRKFWPVEAGWAPFATAYATPENNWYTVLTVGKKEKKGYAWPGVIYHHINHWEYNKLARVYAEKDVVYTRSLYHHFGLPEVNDNDSILACMVGAVRWRGYAIKVDGIHELRKEALKIANSAPKAPKKVYAYIAPALSDVEKAVLKESTKKSVLEKIVKWENHPASILAQQCLDARKNQKKVTDFDKLLMAGRFHASFKVIGALSSRMSGSDDLNAQGIERNLKIRKQFTLAFGELKLVGGDFESYEVTIADARYNDIEFRNQLLTCVNCKFVNTPDDFRKNTCANCKAEGDIFRKVHGLFGMSLSGLDYDEVLKSKGTENDWYDKGKRGFFSQQYGGDWHTLVERLSVDEERAKNAEFDFLNRFKGVALSRLKIEKMFCSMRQPKGIGSRVEWNEPAEYIESMTGFRRYFTIENKIVRALYTLANNTPVSWRNMRITCIRRDREQRVDRAVMSALLAAAFNIQSKIKRAAENHVIQSTGATLTKELECRIWELQPYGVHPWKVQPMNAHDEILTPVIPELKPTVEKIVYDFIEEKKALIPLIKIGWNSNMTSWADK